MSNDHRSDQEIFGDEEAFPDDVAPRSYIGAAETLLRRTIDLIATAPNVPLSTTARLDRESLLELLEDALDSLPTEIREARWMIKERQEFVAKARREADEVMEAARVQAERMVQRTEVVRAAEARARQVLEAAESDALRLKLETEDFLDQRLASFEILLERLSRTVATGREKLSIGTAAELEGSEVEEDPTKGFFDQDG